MAGHWFERVQWTLPTAENYEWLRGLFSAEYLRREYEDLRREYEDLRREYEGLRRPFSVTARDQYSDVWEFDPVQGYPGKHPCENDVYKRQAVAMAACVGMPHPKWDERPIVAVVKRPGTEVTREELLAFYEGKTAKWQIPDDVVFVDAIPLGATGKMLKPCLLYTSRCV